MEALVVGIIVVLGLFLYYGWKDIKANEAKKETPPDTNVSTSKEDIIPVASTKIDVVSTPVVTKEVKQALENVEKVKKTAAKAPRAKAAKEDAPAKVAKVKRQYTKKSKE